MSSMLLNYCKEEKSTDTLDKRTLMLEVREVILSSRW